MPIPRIYCLCVLSIDYCLDQQSSLYESVFEYLVIVFTNNPVYVYVCNYIMIVCLRLSIGDCLSKNLVETSELNDGAVFRF